MMNLRTVDLNLLVVLDALLAECSVTRAAARLGLSQPATSHALSRLRSMFDDELLVRGPSGLEPTTRAAALAGPVAEVLAGVERLMAANPGFDPGTAAREFRVRASDVLGELILPDLMAQLRHAAPGISLDVQHVGPSETIDGLRSGRFDTALSTGLDTPREIDVQDLADDRMVILAARGHPAVANRLDLDAFLRLSHVRVAISPTDQRFVDDVLAKRGLARRIALNVPHWLLVPAIVACTDLVAVMPERLARRLASDDLDYRDVPFDAVSFVWRIYSHVRSRHDDGLAWLHDRIKDALT